MQKDNTTEPTSANLAAENAKNVEKYRALNRASNTGAWEYYPETGTMSFNDVYFSMLGRNINDYNENERHIVDSAWGDLLHPDDKARAVKKFNDYLENPTGVYENYFRLSHADGSWVWIWSRGSSIQYHDGHITIIGTHTDITRHKQIEETILQERLLLRTLIDNLPDPIYVKDKEGRKIIANKSDVKNLGAVTEADVIGKTDLELFQNHFGTRGYEDDMKVLKQGIKILDKEEFFEEENGTKRWMTATKIPIRDENGNISRLLGIGHNITDRKRSEEVLNQLNESLFKQSEELKALNEQLTAQKEQELEKAIAQGKFEIASEVLHDIGNAMVGFGSYLNRINRALELNNLNTVKNLAAFIKGQQAAIANAIGADKAGALTTITEGIANTQSNNNTEISAAIKELSNIISHIQEILNIQRQFVQGHGGGHERKPVNLVNIIDNCKAMLFASLDKKGIQLKTDIPKPSYIVKGDHTKLMQVILNVLKNSIEAIDMDSMEKRISIAINSSATEIELAIADNGMGFDEETGKHFFERGFTTKKTGTGLGLYNCKTIVEAHGGSFTIKSDGPGKGSITTIKLNF